MCCIGGKEHYNGVHGCDKLVKAMIATHIAEYCNVNVGTPHISVVIVHVVIITLVRVLLREGDKEIHYFIT